MARRTVEQERKRFNYLKSKGLISGSWRQMDKQAKREATRQVDKIYRQRKEMAKASSIASKLMKKGYHLDAQDVADVGKKTREKLEKLAKTSSKKKEKEILKTLPKTKYPNSKNKRTSLSGVSHAAFKNKKRDLRGFEKPSDYKKWVKFLKAAWATGNPFIFEMARRDPQGALKAMENGFDFTTLAQYFVDTELVKETNERVSRQELDKMGEEQLINMPNPLAEIEPEFAPDDRDIIKKQLWKNLKNGFDL